MAVPSDAVVSPLTNGSTESWLSRRSILDRIRSLEGEWGEKVSASLSRLTDTIRLLGADRIIVAFNGGKDAVVVLHLLRAAMSACGSEAPFGVLYFKSEDEFPEVESFIRDTMSALDMPLESYTCSWREGMQSVREKYGESPLGIVMGTRFRDPDCRGDDGCAPLLPSSSWTIPFLRIQPIIRWEYADVWRFLHTFALPYCKLYKEGYTSLGTRSNTVPNPALLCEDKTYKAAHYLSDASLERSGRTQAPPTPAPQISAGVLIVSDEILTCKVHDTVSGSVLQALAAQNMLVKKCAIVSDGIADEIQRLSAQVDIVVAIGTRGSTTDDILARSCSEAFGLEVGPREFCEEKILVPSPCELLQSGEQYPVVKVKNVYLFPGSHTSMRAKLSTIVAQQHSPSGNSIDR